MNLFINNFLEKLFVHKSNNELPFFMQKTKIKLYKNSKPVFTGRFFIGILLFSGIFIQNVSAKGIQQKNKNYLKIEKGIINQLNQERIKNNLKPLIFNPILKKAAQLKVDDIIKNNYFAHISPKGVRAWDLLNKVGYDYKFAGENLAMNFKDAESVHLAWMKSKSHKDNILFKDYTEVAVTIGKKRDGSLIAVQFFGKPINTTIEDIVAGTIARNQGKDILKKKNLTNNKSEEINKNLTKGSGNLMTQIIPSQESDYQNNNGIKLSADQIMNLNNMVLLVIGLVCLLLVVNVWVLEKEDERIIAEAKKIYKVKEALASS